MDKMRLFFGMIILTALAGLVNALSICYFGTTVSHVTGLFSNLAINISKGDFSQVLWFGGVILSFLVGAIVAGIITEERAFYLHKRYGVVIIFIGIILGLSVLLLSKYEKVLVFVFAFLMGLQNGMVVSFRGIVVRMTHMSGNLTDLGVFIGYKIRGKSKEKKEVGLVPGCALLGFIIGGIIGILAYSGIGVYTYYITAGLYVIFGVLYIIFQIRCTDKNFNGIPDELEKN